MAACRSPSVTSPRETDGLAPRCRSATLGRALAARADVRVCAIILNEGRLAEELRGAGIDVLAVLKNRTRILDIFRSSCGFLRGRGVDVSHSHRYKEKSAGRNVGSQTLDPVHGPYGARAPGALPRLEAFSKMASMLALDRLAARRWADRVIAVTEDVRGHLSRHIALQKIRVVNNAIELERVASRLSPRMPRRGWEFRRCNCGRTAARLEPIKRMDPFVKTCQRIRAAQKNAVFVVAGDGDPAPIDGTAGTRVESDFVVPNAGRTERHGRCFARNGRFSDLLRS